MCICVNCHYVDSCQTYHAVEEQHQQPHLTNNPTFDPKEPTINVNIRPKEDYIEMEWDVVGCESFLEETGKWMKLRPGEPVPA
ncbi:unknown [Crocosphaera subtropica ATCC 51142]|uniref:Ycf34 family protein n=1 Tax=Crocosphaera subtropica (strain ATCC 51142 / BH68) TaxID=43989 RepID=B1WYW7_CROS5|nr:Ycf34 family protein [Crocosphaera subtropica]ACB52731.1 unknown [Crocosphaera subtropica ATCC 51142]